MRSRSIFIKRFRQLLVLGTVATIVLAASPAMAEVIDAGPVQVGTTSQDNASDTVAISNGGSAGGGLVGVSTTGFASGLLLGVSGTNCAFGFLGAGISGTGCAVGYVAVSGMDPAAGQVAVSGTDGAYAALVGVSGTGFGGGGLAGVSVLGPAFGGTAAISGANTATAPVALGGTSGAAYPCANHGGVRFASARTEAGVIEIRVYCNDGTQEGPFVYRVPAG